jgi:hypothetical protein
MSKIITMTRSLGEYLPRYDGAKFVDTDGKTIHDAIIVVPDKRGELIRRVGKYDVKDNDLPTDVIKSFDIGSIPALNIRFDDNYDKFKVNQDNSSFEEINTQKYKVIADITKLQTYTTDKGTHKYVVIGINTGESSIVGLKFNGYTLGKVDEDKVLSMGYDKGYIMYWYPFELGETTIVIEKDNKSSAVTIVSENK